MKNHAGETIATAQQGAFTLDGARARIRVRTPGKHVVLYLFAPVIVIAIGSGLWLNEVTTRNLTALEYRKNSIGEQAAYFNLPDFLVDLSPDRSGRTAYLKMRVSIALRHADVSKTAQHIDTLEPVLNERLTFFLRELRPEDFSGSESMARIKSELLRRVNLVIAPQEAADVIISELVIQ